MRYPTTQTASKRIRSLIAFGFVAILVGAAGPAAAATYSNTASITINDLAAATPYPSNISVPTAGVVADVNATLTGITHQFSQDIEALLVGPTGKSVLLMAHNGSGSISGVNLTFDDEATTPIPVEPSVVTSGTYKATSGPFVALPAPAPATSYGSTLSVFDGTNPAGTWSLFVYDRYAGGSGMISGGWSLNVTLASLSSFTPSTGKVGASVVLTGVGFTGATAVKFGGTLASTFTVDSDTQITATVPAGASTGSIAVTTPTLGMLTSASDFVVTHDRNVSINLNGKKATGTVNVADGFTNCGKTVPVKVQHFEHGRWKTVAGVLTKADGSYKAVGLQDKGKFRAVAKKTTVGSGDVCNQAVSPTVKK